MTCKFSLCFILLIFVSNTTYFIYVKVKFTEASNRLQLNFCVVILVINNVLFNVGLSFVAHFHATIRTGTKNSYYATNFKLLSMLLTHCEFIQAYY